MKELAELHKELIALFAYYAELEGAINTWHETLKSRILNAITSDKPLHIGRDNPNDPGARYLYTKPFRFAIQDATKDGPHVSTHRKAVIALTYAVWEDEYRARIANECGFKDKRDIKSDVFQDLNMYRQAILHVNGRLDREPNVLKFFNKGETVAFTEDQMTELFSTLIEELNRIGKEYYESNPEFSFERALNRASRPQFLLCRLLRMASLQINLQAMFLPVGIHPPCSLTAKKLNDYGNKRALTHGKQGEAIAGTASHFSVAARLPVPTGHPTPCL